MKGLKFAALFSCTVVCRLQWQLQPRYWSCPTATTRDFEQCTNGEHIDFTSRWEQDPTAGSQATGVGVETRCRGTPRAGPQGSRWRPGQGGERHRYSTTRQSNTLKDFDVLLTVHLSIFILVINQLDAQNLFYNKFISCLYMIRTPCAHRQEVKIVLYSFWYHHTYREVHGTATYRCDDTRDCII